MPDYQVEESGPDHQKSFRAVVIVGGRELGSGEGRSKKEAEQHAAETAWNMLNEESGAAKGGGSDPGVRDEKAGGPAQAG